MNKLQKITDALSLLGLSDMETLIYIDLIKLGNSPASNIARRLKLNRSTVRYTLENLAKKRFIFQENRNGTYFFTAEDPDKILLLIQSEQREIEEKELAVSQIIGDLKSMKNPHVNIPKVRFFEGVDGIIKMYEDVLISNTTIYGYSRVDPKNVHTDILKFLKGRYTEERKKNKNKSFMLYNKIHNKEYLKNDKELKRTTLKIPSKIAEFHSCFHIYGNKVAFYSRTPDDLTGILIENDTIRHDQLAFFKLAWNFAKSLPENSHYQDIEIN